MNEIIFKKIVDEGEEGSVSISYEMNVEEVNDLPKKSWQFSRIDVRVDNKGRFHSVAYGDKALESLSVYRG